MVTTPGWIRWNYFLRGQGSHNSQTAPGHQATWEQRGWNGKANPKGSYVKMKESYRKHLTLYFPSWHSGRGSGNLVDMSIATCSIELPPPSSQCGNVLFWNPSPLLSESFVIFPHKSANISQVSLTKIEDIIEVSHCIYHQSWGLRVTCTSQSLWDKTLDEREHFYINMTNS